MYTAGNFTQLGRQVQTDEICPDYKSCLLRCARQNIVHSDRRPLQDRRKMH